MKWGNLISKHPHSVFFISQIYASNPAPLEASRATQYRFMIALTQWMARTCAMVIPDFSQLQKRIKQSTQRSETISKDEASLPLKGERKGMQKVHLMNCSLKVIS